MKIEVTATFIMHFYMPEGTSEDVIKDNIVPVLAERMKKIENLYPMRFMEYNWKFDKNSKMPS